jgi:hypothetical protein
MTGIPLPSHATNPSFLNVFMKKLTQERVVPNISASDFWLIEGITIAGLPSLPKRGSNMGSHDAEGQSRSESESAVERRRWERLPISIPLFVRGVNSSGEEFLEFSTALNVSAGGILLAMRSYLDAGMTVSVEVPPSLHQLQLPRASSRFRAKVLRSIRSRHYFLMGLEFEIPLLSES